MFQQQLFQDFLGVSETFDLYQRGCVIQTQGEVRWPFFLYLVKMLCSTIILPGFHEYVPPGNLVAHRVRMLRYQFFNLFQSQIMVARL